MYLLLSQILSRFYANNKFYFSLYKISFKITCVITWKKISAQRLRFSSQTCPLVETSLTSPGWLIYSCSQASHYSINHPSLWVMCFYVLIVVLFTRLCKLLKGRDHITEFCKQTLTLSIKWQWSKNPFLRWSYWEKRLSVRKLLGMHHSQTRVPSAQLQSLFLFLLSLHSVQLYKE